MDLRVTIHISTRNTQYSGVAISNVAKSQGDEYYEDAKWYVNVIVYVNV